MTSRRLNFALWAATATFGTAALVALVMAATLPLGRPADGVAAPTSKPAKGSAPDGIDARLAAADWSRPLRAPLVAAADASTTRPVDDATTDAAPGALTLLGTIGDSLAIVRSADGVVSTVAVADVVGGARVTAIRRSEVVMELNGLRTTLRRAADAELPSLDGSPK